MNWFSLFNPGYAITIIGVTVLWAILILRWIDKNPRYASQVKNHEAPYPWFFYVWEFLFFASIGSIIYLICHYISKILR